VKGNVGRAIVGGFVGTVLLTLMMCFVAPMMTGQRMDIAARLGDMVGVGPGVGMVMHFLNGSVIFALIYVYVLCRFLPGTGNSPGRPAQAGTLSEGPLDGQRAATSVPFTLTSQRILLNTPCWSANSITTCRPS